MTSTLESDPPSISVAPISVYENKQKHQRPSSPDLSSLLSSSSESTSASLEESKQVFIKLKKDE
jgi:hypothetical protein